MTDDTNPGRKTVQAREISPQSAQVALCGATGKPHRYVDTTRKGRVCGDCGAPAKE